MRNGLEKQGFYSLIDPDSIIVVGGSPNIEKPGGRILKNLLDKGFSGDIQCINPKYQEIHGVPSYPDPKSAPEADLAVLAVPAKDCPGAVRELGKKNGVKAFIVLSGGFGEEGEEGEKLEGDLVKAARESNAILIGPNCIGVITPHYKGVFTQPIPHFDKDGCDLVSSSGATAVFIMEAGMRVGMRFAHVFSIGNSAMIGVEEILEYLDRTYEEGSSNRVKLLYMETIRDPQKFLKHTSSLIEKGARVAAIKAGASNAGSKAASSHTGAIATSDDAVRALFKKAGVVYCSGREELITVGSVFQHHPNPGKKFGVITHAGGSAVMLTDALERGGVEVPTMDPKDRSILQRSLSPGSSTMNPIDILATGTAQQLGAVVDHCCGVEELDGVIVVFGSPGLRKVKDAYEVICDRVEQNKKPVLPVLPSVVNANDEMEIFREKGIPFFTDEVVLGTALGAIHKTPVASDQPAMNLKWEQDNIKGILDGKEEGFLSDEDCRSVLRSIGLPIAEEFYVHSRSELKQACKKVDAPWVLKVVGPIHRSDIGGVALGIRTEEELLEKFDELLSIKGSEGVMLQPMLSGPELFLGVKHSPPIGHLLLFGLGGVHVEIIDRVEKALIPLSYQDARRLVDGSPAKKLIEGYRGSTRIEEDDLIDLILRISMLVREYPLITEMDLNPIICTPNGLKVVDHCIHIEGTEGGSLASVHSDH